jgi:hypothetical protein
MDKDILKGNDRKRVKQEFFVIFLPEMRQENKTDIKAGIKGMERAPVSTLC